MKLLFDGLGSIGSRHLRDTASILASRGVSARFFARRSSNRPLPADVSALLEKSYDDYEALPDDFDAAYICTPTALHFDSIRALSKKASALFIEKPVLEKPRDIARLNLDDEKIYYVACPLRFSPPLRFAKEFLRDKTVLRVAAECSSYLPEWRSTDYRRSYSASKENGGGVRLDLIHEWDYLIWLFGEPDRIKSVSGRASGLDIDSEDFCVYTALFGKAPLSLSLDYFGRWASRSCTVVYEGGRAEFDLITNEARIYEDGKCRVERFDKLDIRKAEAEYFLDLIGKKEPNINTVDNALAALAAALE